MSQERVERFSPETKAAFADWVKKRGLKVVLFDLDGTLVDTTEVFIRQFDLFYLYCQEQLPNVDLNKFKSEVVELNDSLFATMGVSTKKWEHLIDLLSEKHGVNLSQGLTLFQEIYRTPSRVFDGVKETLELCREVGLKVGLVTHGTASWTDEKLRELGFGFDHVNCVDVDEHKHKGPEHWRESVDYFEVSPSEVMVVGDNLKGDILASHQIGVKTLVWIPSDWGVYNQGEEVEGIYKIDKIGDLIPTLCQKK